MFTNMLQKNWKPGPLAALFALLPPKKNRGEGRIETREAQRSVSGLWSHPARVSWWAQTILGPQRPGVLGTQGPRSASPTHPSTTVTHTQSCTLPWLISQTTSLTMVTLTQYNHTATQNVSIVKHPTSLCSAPSHTSLYSQLKNFSAHTLKITALQLSVQHIKLWLGHHMTMCVCCSQGESIGFGNWPTCVQAQVLPFISSFTLDKWFKVPEPQF